MKDLRVGGRIILKWISNKYGARVWTGFIWLRTGSNVEFLSTRVPYNGEISSPAELL
jgi:hypothetical protein